MASSEYNVPVPEDRVTISCLHCGKSLEVSRKALTVTCKFCHKSLKLEDLRIKDYTARRTVDTVGIVTVEKKGSIIAEKVQCGGLIVRGKVKSEVVSFGPVLVGPEGEVIGNVTTPSLAVGAGAILNGFYRVGLKPMEVADDSN